MRVAAAICAGVACFALAGCSAVSKKVGQLVAAEPLDALAAYENPAAGPAPTTPQAIVGAIVIDSMNKCSEFSNGLVLNENTANTGLDIATTVFSALGTLFTPLATVHAMTAGATITSGSKTAIDTDIYSKMSIANFAQAIQQTYYADMKIYVNGLSATAAITPELEYAKIAAIHRECALAPAEMQISAALTTQTQTTTLVFSYSVSPSDASGGLSVLAGHILNAINATQAFQSAGVSAAPVQGNPAAIMLNSSPTTSIAWSTNVASGTGTGKGTETAVVSTTGGVTTLTLAQTITANDVITLTGNLKSGSATQKQ